MQKTLTPSNESQRREQFGAGSDNSSFGASTAICHTVEQLPPDTRAFHPPQQQLGIEHWWLPFGKTWPPAHLCLHISFCIGRNSKSNVYLNFLFRVAARDLRESVCIRAPHEGGCKDFLDSHYPTSPWHPMASSVKSMFGAILSPSLKGSIFLTHKESKNTRLKKTLEVLCTDTTVCIFYSVLGGLDLQAKGLENRWWLPKYHSSVACMLWVLCCEKLCYQWVLETLGMRKWSKKYTWNFMGEYCFKT